VAGIDRDDAPDSLGELLWRLLGDRERRSALTRLGITAVGLACLLLSCAGVLACGLFLVLSYENTGEPALISGGALLGVSATRLIGAVKRWWLARSVRVRRLPRG
jgi:hypothetical protein